MLETSFYGIWHSQLGKVYCKHLPSMVTISLYQRSLKCSLVDAWVSRPAPPVATSQYTIRCKIVKSVQSRPQSLRSPCTAWGKRRLWDNPSPEAFWLASYNLINSQYFSPDVPFQNKTKWFILSEVDEFSNFISSSCAREVFTLKSKVDELRRVRVKSVKQQKIEFDWSARVI